MAVCEMLHITVTELPERMCMEELMHWFAYLRGADYVRNSSKRQILKEAQIQVQNSEDGVPQQLPEGYTGPKRAKLAKAPQILSAKNFVTRNRTKRR